MTIFNTFNQIVVQGGTVDVIGILTQNQAIMQHIATSCNNISLVKEIYFNLNFSPLLDLKNIPIMLKPLLGEGLISPIRAIELYNSSYDPYFRLLPFSLLIDSVSNPAVIQEMFNSIKTMSEERIYQSTDIVTIINDHTFFKYIISTVSNFSVNSIEGQTLLIAQKNIRLLFLLSHIIFSKNNPNFSSELANVSDSKAETIAEHVAVAHFLPIRKNLKIVFEQKHPEINPIFEFADVEDQFIADQTVNWGATSTLAVFRDYQAQEKGIKIAKRLITDLSDLV